MYGLFISKLYILPGKCFFSVGCFFSVIFIYLKFHWCINKKRVITHCFHYAVGICLPALNVRPLPRVTFRKMKHSCFCIMSVGQTGRAEMPLYWHENKEDYCSSKRVHRAPACFIQLRGGRCPSLLRHIMDVNRSKLVCATCDQCSGFGSCRTPQGTFHMSVGSSASSLPYSPCSLDLEKKIFKHSPKYTKSIAVVWKI